MKRVLLVSVAVTVIGISACDSSDESQSSDNAASSAPSPPSTAEIAKAHMPAFEAEFVKAHDVYRADVNSPNNIIVEDIQDKKAKVWREVVLRHAVMKDWSATVNNITSEGRVVLELSDGIRVWADVPANSDLFNVIKTLNDRTHDPVIFSAKIDQTNIDSTKAATDNTVSPSCFEDDMGIRGCQIDLEGLKLIGGDETPASY
ncbi:hypothetical protein [Asticcacaulis solisilvae]|uniref:hypothetical protein n=1 Tax=Asticcacaulis solisilvae TaxID=1217274 RepID=UPI003FD6FCAC